MLLLRRWQEQRVNLELAIEPGEEVVILALFHVRLVHLLHVGPEPLCGAVVVLPVLLGQLLHEVLDHPRQRREAPHAEELRRLGARVLVLLRLGGLRRAPGAEELRAPREHLQEVDGLLVNDLHGVVHEVAAQQRRDGENLCVVALRDAGAKEALRVHEPHLRAVGCRHVGAAEPDAHGLRRDPASDGEDPRVADQAVEQEALPRVVRPHDRHDGDALIVLSEPGKAVHHGDHRRVVPGGPHDLDGLVELDRARGGGGPQPRGQRQGPGPSQLPPAPGHGTAPHLPPPPTDRGPRP
mmetsp:Transcript_1145/g.3269  ORF Transcript_1145/g.3269 Transcript_1145/m.3269 type:complete len:296 (-) Transcript_1145:2-889(-)